MPDLDNQPVSRGRVVMIVDNSVVGDSRVQKTARSAAAAGWDVTVLGKTNKTAPATWSIGDAKVRLIPVGTTLSSYQRPRAWLRRPFAYPIGATLSYRQQAVQAKRADLAARRADDHVARKGGVGRRLSSAELLARRASLKTTDLWVRFRARETRRLAEVRKSRHALINRTSAKFWQLTMGKRAWRRLDGWLWDWELALGPVIDKLKPDLIHAHDFRMIGVGARAAQRARAKGRPVKFVYDAHEFVRGLPDQDRTPSWLPAQTSYEKEFIRYADAVVCISDDLADLLRNAYHLPETPTVVLNAPVGERAVDEPIEDATDLRTQCGIDASTPLLAYCGGINAVRGVDLMVEALVDLPGVHLAMLSVHPNGLTPAARNTLAQAEKLGIADRLHLLPYVAHWQVSSVLRTADAAVSPLQHLLNHEIAMSNKFFEYSQARLPLITSDVRTMAEAVRATGQGEVFVATDRADYVRAVKAVLADPARYRAAYDKPGLLEGWRWEAQASKLDAIYGRLVPGAERPASTPQDTVPAVA
jgi:glycogen(starch) synthase